MAVIQRFCASSSRIKITTQWISPSYSCAFSTSQHNHADKNYKLLVVGGGTGGCAIANKFAPKLGKDAVGVIEPSLVSNVGLN